MLEVNGVTAEYYAMQWPGPPPALTTSAEQKYLEDPRGVEVAMPGRGLIMTQYQSTNLKHPGLNHQVLNHFVLILFT